MSLADDCLGRLPANSGSLLGSSILFDWPDEHKEWVRRNHKVGDTFEAVPPADEDFEFPGIFELLIVARVLFAPTIVTAATKSGAEVELAVRDMFVFYGLSSSVNSVGALDPVCNRNLRLEW
jgi:hypothetical protein